MKKVLSYLLCFLFIANIASGANLWRKGTGEDVLLGGEDAADIDTISFGNIVDPLDRLLAKYQRGSRISCVSATTVSVAMGEITCSNAAGSIRRMRQNTSSTSVTFSDLDTGSEAAGTYYVYGVADADATTYTFKLSLSATAPTGVTYFYRIGSIVNDSSLEITEPDIVNDGDYFGLSWGGWEVKADSTVYQAPSDGEVVAYDSSGGRCQAFTDSSNPPTTLRTWGDDGVVCPVREGDYYKITGSTNVFWIEQTR